MSELKLGPPKEERPEEVGRDGEIGGEPPHSKRWQGGGVKRPLQGQMQEPTPIVRNVAFCGGGDVKSVVDETVATGCIWRCTEAPVVS